jgi:hypothetical protein
VHPRPLPSACFAVCVVTLFGLSLPMSLAAAQSVPSTSKVSPGSKTPAKPGSKPGSKEGKQGASPTPPTSPTSPTTTPEAGGQGKPGSGLEFTGERVRIESVGFAMELPSGCRAESNGVAGQPAIQITPADATWIMNAKVQKTSSGSSLKAVADAMTEQATSREGGGATLVDRAAGLTIGGKPAERFYLKSASTDASKAAIINGYTIFEPLKGQFVVIEVLAGEGLWTKAKTAYETIVATATFEDPQMIEQSRRVAVDAGIKLLAGLTAQDLADIAGTTKKERWERKSLPAASGAKTDEEEQAYRRITTWAGKRGEMDLKRDAGKLSGSDLDDGYIVQIQARLLTPQTKISGPRPVIDVFSSFFLSKDRKSEAWVVKMTQREGGKSLTSTETGARVGDQMTVRLDDPNGVTRNIDPLIRGGGYISRVEAYLLPQIMARSKVPLEFGFYAYQSELSRIVLRNDVLAPIKDKPGAWQLTTKLNPDAKPQVSIMNERGDVTQTVMPDGSVWQPTTLDELRRLWQSKSLPMD